MPYACKKAALARHRAYNAANAATIRVATRASRALNPEAARERQRLTYMLRGDLWRARRRERYHSDPEYRARILTSNRRSKERAKGRA